MSEDLTKAYNLMWIPPRPYVSSMDGDGNFCQPIPDKTVKNVLAIAERNQKVDVRLWVDSRRIVGEQRQWLENMVGDCHSNNMSLLDLQSIADYRDEPLYNQPDTNLFWRSEKHSLIWRQVDAARILACLESDFDQVFYSDADITNLVVDSPEVQRKLEKQGVIISAGYFTLDGKLCIENGLFGFDGRKREFFRKLYDQTVRDAVNNKLNGYLTYIHLINELEWKDKIDKKEIIFFASYDETRASHPGQDKKEIIEAGFFGESF